MPRCDCGQYDHKDQIEKYPVGTIIYFVPDYEVKSGKVVNHCADGRAVLEIAGESYMSTYHDLDSYVERVELPDTIERLKARITELEFLFNAAIEQRDKADALNVAQADEIERLKAGLTQAEDIYAGMVGAADRIGELLFGFYALEDPTGNGNERYWPACAVFLPILDAEKVARLINEMMDVDWVHVDGEVGQ